MVCQLSKTSLGMPLGSILEEAALVSRAQIEVALRDQIYNDNLRIGEILALRGWIKQETADFFVISFPNLKRQVEKRPLGEYLQEAYLLNDQQIKAILQEQKQTFMRFGALAVLKGYLKQETVNFFINYLFPEHKKDSFFMKTLSGSNIAKETIHRPQPVSMQPQTYTEDDLEYLAHDGSVDNLDVHWLD